jgi:thiamine biosynthesis lipoprotein
MYKRIVVARYFVFILCFCLFTSPADAQQHRFSFERIKMGSPFRILMIAADSLQADSLAEKAFAMVDEANAVFSDYDTTSELSRLNRSSGQSEPLVVSKMLYGMLKLSRDAYRKSDGAFDVSVGPLSRIWRQARKENRFPQSGISEARRLVGFHLMRLKDADHSVLLPLRGMSLDFGGIAKGYVASWILHMLGTYGVRQALVDAGGDMAIGDAPPGTDGWAIGVAIPEETGQLFPRKLILKNTCIATSGSIYQYLEHEGRKYSHIIDPRSGYGISSRRNVTVLTRLGWEADWLATACSVLPIDKAKRLARRNNAELLITELVDGQLEYHSTRGFNKFWK